jgi:hypothetical protein
MARLLRIYFNALFGGLGGLLGWMLFGEFVPREGWDWWLQALVGGALIGAVIGYFVVSVDAILDRALVRFTRYAAYGVVLGGLGGALGFWVGDWVNFALVPQAGQESLLRTLGTVVARGLGWMLFGLAVGLSEGIAARSLGKLSYGAIGGTLGGFIGGAVFGSLMIALTPGEQSYIWGQALGLVILGACIGSLVALVEEVLKPAAIKVVRGWQEGREYPLVKAASVVGRDEAADILLLRDMKVEKRHVIIHRRGNRFVLVNNRAPAPQTLVNDEPIDQSCELHDGDRIQLGNVVLRFLQRAAAGRSPRRR